MADSACTRDERRERIVAECNAVRQALQDLLSEYMANAGMYVLGKSSELCCCAVQQKKKALYADSCTQGDR